MTDKVLDASAAVAFLFNEPAREAIVDQIRESVLHAPALLGFEIASACLKKLRTVPGERQALLKAFSLVAELPVIIDEVDLAAAIALAERMNLTLYDASYLWLAQALGVELVTLDERLARSAEELRGSTHRASSGGS